MVVPPLADAGIPPRRSKLRRMLWIGTTPPVTHSNEMITESL
jgi:hypothetical protein